MTSEQPTPLLPKLSLNGWATLTQAGRTVKAALERAQATPEYKVYLEALTLHSDLKALLGVPSRGVVDFKGEIEMVMDRNLQEMEWLSRQPHGPGSTQEHAPVEHPLTPERQAIEDMLAQTQPAGAAPEQPET